MKNTKSSIAILVMAIVVFASLIMTSCKKETEKATNQQLDNNKKMTELYQIEDMNAYLADFKKKMTESKENEPLCLESAAWHLSSLANRDFCNVSVDYNDVKFDTVEMRVNITNGTVLLSDLSAAYDLICSEIHKYKASFDQNNQNLYYIDVIIKADGHAKIALMTSYVNASRDLSNHHWYFPDTFGYIDSVCYCYFNDDSPAEFPWNGLAKTELQRVLNIFEHHNNNGHATYFTNLRNKEFGYQYYIDPYGSSFFSNSRLFAHLGDYALNYKLDFNEMCYCLDSYLGLGYDFIGDSLSSYTNVHPIDWVVNDVSAYYSYGKYNHIHYHILNVQYGRLYESPINPPGGDDL